MHMILVTFSHSHSQAMYGEAKVSNNFHTMAHHFVDQCQKVAPPTQMASFRGERYFHDIKEMCLSSTFPERQVTTTHRLGRILTLSSGVQELNPYATGSQQRGRRW